MKVSLFGLLIFLFCCAGVYYASQFAVVSNLDGNSDIERRRFLAASRLNVAYEKADGVAAPYIDNGVDGGVNAASGIVDNGYEVTCILPSMNVVEGQPKQCTIALVDQRNWCAEICSGDASARCATRSRAKPLLRAG